MGIRGLPAAHGGFETFAERLALYLVERGWKVTVYCQGSASGRREVDVWEGVERIHIPVKRDGSIGTIEFDIKATMDVLSLPGTILTLGYNTGFLCSFLSWRRRKNFINMDGLEWKRAKYSTPAKIYLWVNERLAAWAGTKLVADHPSIAEHLATRVPHDRIATIPYGAPGIDQADITLLADYGVEAHRYLTVIARAEPENSILEIVQGFSAKPRGMKLLVLGKYTRDHDYHCQVMAAASDEVLFPGPVYEASRIQALRFYSLAYIHGHQVGGTNPSLVEALGAGNAVIAHDNKFNRWVAGGAGLYFVDAADVSKQIDDLIADPSLQRELSSQAVKRWLEAFTWPDILAQYEELMVLKC
nr:DUF1972 domain-containing protein [Novosphingobium sediminicola]